MGALIFGFVHAVRQSFEIQIECAQNGRVSLQPGIVRAGPFVELRQERSLNSLDLRIECAVKRVQLSSEPALIFVG